MQYMMGAFRDRVQLLTNYPKQYQMPNDMLDLNYKLSTWRSIDRTLKEIARVDGHKVNSSDKQCHLQDHWGNEIYYLVSEDGIIACMSAGPNKKWELGKGDDLVVDTNMNLSKTLPLPDTPNPKPGTP